MNSWMHLRNWSSVGLLPARAPGGPGAASASRISSAMRARRSLRGDAACNALALEAPPLTRRPRPCPGGPARRPRPAPRTRPRSQRHDVSVGRLHCDGQRVPLLLVQGVLVRAPLQEQANLAKRRGRRARQGLSREGGTSVVAGRGRAGGGQAGA